jgi:D-proline reductase (dithiol) PrdB
MRSQLVKAIKYVDALNDHYTAMGNPPYRWTVNESAPLHRLDKPLNQCTVSLLTSGGVSQCSMPAFNPDARNDHRLDAIDQDVDAKDFQIHDSYYNHSDADSDINCIFPVERLRELAAAGEIGKVSDRLWSGFMGRIYNRSKVLDESAPAFAEALIEDGVDLLIAAPS